MPATRRTWKSGTTRRSTGTKTKWYGRTTARSTWPSTSYSPSKYNTQKRELQAKIGSYRAINQQFSGVGNVTAFSPSGANKWIKYVSQGACVYKFNNVQFCRWFGAQWNNATPTAAYRYLRHKFGVGIKAVTRGKGSNWLVAATPKITARPFCNYTWT
ncbi:MAG: hypothetical protein ACE5I3_13920 [Phycisphaerae bacterium]